MFEGFSKEAALTLSVARTLRGSRGDQYVGTQHILLALATGTSSRVAEILSTHDITSNTIRPILESNDLSEGRRRPPQRTADGSKGPNMSDDVVRVLQRAFTRAGSGPGGREDVTTEALLLAIIDDATCSAHRVLSLLPVDEEGLRSELGQTR